MTCVCQLHSSWQSIEGRGNAISRKMVRQKLIPSDAQLGSHFLMMSFIVQMQKNFCGIQRSDW